MDEPLFLGIDGGGTRCRAVLRDGTGRLLAQAEAGRANVYQNFAGALAEVTTAAEAAARAAGLAAASLSRMHAGLGLAGILSPADAARVAAARLPFASVYADSDAAAACRGAHGGGDGGIVICGTGSAAFALIGQDRIALGGWGFALGDAGSAAALGRAALRHALEMQDGLAPASLLGRRILAHFGAPAAMVTWAAGAAPRDYGSFAPWVSAAAGEGCSLASQLLDEAAADIGALLSALIQKGAPRLSLIGGLAPVIAPRLAPALQRKLSDPLASAADGALMMAKAVRGVAA